MKKTILFEPALLAEVNRKSPAVYEFYSNSPFSEFEYVEFCLGSEKYLIQKEIIDFLDERAVAENLDVTMLKLSLQAGYKYGRFDLLKKYPGDNAESLQASLLIGELLNLAMNYPYYDADTLFSMDNFGTRHGFPYSKLTYQEAQCLMAWETIFSRHVDFNGLFVPINEARKRLGLVNMGPMDFSSFYN